MPTVFRDIRGSLWLFSPILVLNTIAFVLCILALVAGQDPNTLKNLGMILFDTSSISAALQNTPGSEVTAAIPDWYEAHYLSVCHGTWVASLSRVKDAATTACEARPAGYTFSLASELGAFAPSLATGYFGTKPTSYGTVLTDASLGLLITTIALLLISSLSHIAGLVEMKRNITQVPLVLLRISFFTESFAGTIMTNSAAQITAKLSKSLGSAPVNVPGDIYALSGNGFLAVIWTATAIIWVAIILSIILAFRLRISIMQQCGNDTHVNTDNIAKDAEMGNDTI